MGSNIVKDDEAYSKQFYPHDKWCFHDVEACHLECGYDTHNNQCYKNKIFAYGRIEIELLGAMAMDEKWTG